MMGLHDGRNTFNLALDHLVAGHQEEFNTPYRSDLNASWEMIEMAVRNLEELRE